MTLFPTCLFNVYVGTQACVRYADDVYMPVPPGKRSKGAGRRPLANPLRPGAARNPVQKATPQAPPNSPLANGSGLKQIGVLKPGANPFARLAPTGGVSD